MTHSILVGRTGYDEEDGEKGGLDVVFLLEVAVELTKKVECVGTKFGDVVLEVNQFVAKRGVTQFVAKSLNIEGGDVGLVDFARHDKEEQRTISITGDCVLLDEVAELQA